MAEKLRISIAGTQRLRYRQTVEMDSAEWKRLKSLSAAAARQAIEDLVDFDNVFTHGDFEDWNAVVVDAEDKAIVPADRYQDPHGDGEER